MLVGYERVSTAEQSLAPQTDRLKEAGCEKIYSDVVSGAKEARPGLDEALDYLLESHNISGTGIYGENETNDSRGNISFALPIYTQLETGQIINLCGNNRQAEYNGLDVRRYVRYDSRQSGERTIRAQTSTASVGRDPVVDIYRRGQLLTRLDRQGRSDSEVGQFIFETGEYILEVYDYLNIDQNRNTGGASCFDVSVE